jgi:hypothetical protein
VTLGNQRHPIRIPRHRSRAGGEVALANWAALKGTSALDEALLKRVLYGLSYYEAAAQATPAPSGLPARASRAALPRPRR